MFTNLPCRALPGSHRPPTHSFLCVTRAIPNHLEQHETPAADYQRVVTVVRGRKGLWGGNCMRRGGRERGFCAQNRCN